MTRDLFFIEKISAENRLDSQRGQPIRGDKQAGEVLPSGRIAAVEEVAPSASRDLLERVGVLLQVAELFGRGRVCVTALVGGPNMNEALWLGERQGAQKCGVDEPENCGICADAEGKCDDRCGGEAWRFTKHPGAEMYVLHDAFEKMCATGFAALFLDLFCAAYREVGAAGGFLRGEASTDVFLDFVDEVRAQLFI